MKKTFDCIEMKRRGALAVYETVKDMTREEEVSYWQGRAQEMRDEQKRQKEVSSEIRGSSAGR